MKGNREGVEPPRRLRATHLLGRAHRVHSTLITRCLFLSNAPETPQLESNQQPNRTVITRTALLHLLSYAALGRVREEASGCGALPCPLAKGEGTLIGVVVVVHGVGGAGALRHT